MSTTTTKEPVFKSSTAEAVANNVVKKLGTPPNFFKAKAINVFGNWYRVNVYINIDASNDERLIKRSSISYSFLVEVDKINGEILDSKPEIIKQFE